VLEWYAGVRPARLMKKFIERLTERTTAMRIGNPLDPTTQVGSLISQQHLRKVLGYIARGRAEGARVLCGVNRSHTASSRTAISCNRRI